MQKGASFDDHMAMQAVLTVPEAIANFLPPEPTTLKQAKSLLEWSYWKGAMDIKMARLIKSRVCDQVPRPNNKLVVGTNMLN